MLWRYTRHEMKVLLIATLCVSTGCAFVASRALRNAPDNLTANTVGVFAGVAPNAVNMRMDELDARERVLTAREAALTTTAPTPERAILAEIAAGIVLLGLILLNFYLDHKRRVRVA